MHKVASYGKSMFAKMVHTYQDFDTELSTGNRMMLARLQTLLLA